MELKQEELRALKALIPVPPQTFTCGLCFLHCEGKGHTLDGLEVCGYCTYHCEFPTDTLADVLDFAVCRLLGFRPGSRTVGAGTLLPPPPPGQKKSTTQFDWVDIDALVKAFDERYAGSAFRGYLKYPNARVDRPGTPSQWTVLGDPEFVSAPSPVRRGRRPLSAAEREAHELDQLDRTLAHQEKARQLKKDRLAKEIDIKTQLLQALESV